MIPNSLYDQGGKPLTNHNECFRIISLLAFAANNPAVLCTSGRPFRFGRNVSAFSWLRWPVGYDEDNMSTAGRTQIKMAQISVAATPNREVIQLNCLTLGHGYQLYPPSDLYVSKAQRFPNACIAHHVGYLMDRFYNWRQLIELIREARYIYTIIVACMMRCGIPWILSALKLCGKSFAFHRIAEGLLLNKNSVSKTSLGESLLQTTKGREQIDIVLKFGYYIFEKCVHRPWDLKPISPVVPYIIFPASSGPYLIFSPPDRAVTAVIPTALLEVGYADLPRVWLLSKEVVDGVPRFELQGRSRIFGASLPQCTISQRVKRLKIYGPSQDETVSS